MSWSYILGLCLGVFIGNLFGRRWFHHDDWTGCFMVGLIASVLCLFFCLIIRFWS